MERYSCAEHLDEMIDITVVDWEVAPDFELAEPGHICYLCQEEAKYKLMYEEQSQE